MSTYALIAAEYLVMGGCAAFAYSQGGRGEQLGAAWFGVNMAMSATAFFSGLDSPLVHLIQDGIFALGLLPLAMIFVSYWIGLVTLIAAALFSLEALYLLKEWPTDNTYAWINNSLWFLVVLVYLSAGTVSLLRNRRAARQARGSESAAVSSVLPASTLPPSSASC